MIDFTNIRDSSFDKFSLTFESIGMLEFAFNDADRATGVAGVVLFTGMLVLPATGIDDRGFPDIFLG